MKSQWMAAVGTAALAFAAVTAHSQCPAYGSAGGCNEVITINADNSVTVAGMPAYGTNYDGSDDVLVGFVNNSSSSVSSIFLNGNGADIFGFDGDGIDAYGAPGNSVDKTGYGGPDAYFSGISSDAYSGTVDFVNPIDPGGSTYFSLEESFDASNPPTPGPVGGGGGSSVTPEPNSLVLLGTGVLGMAGAMRRRLFQS